MGAPAGYHDTEAFDVALDACLARAGDRAAGREIGRSVEGRTIRAVTIAGPGRVPDSARPHAFVLGSIHGCEVIASELALALIEASTDPDPRQGAAELLDVADLTVVPVLNVDGRAATMASLDSTRWWAGAPRRNAHGVDLNRNWPFPQGVQDHWLPIAGTRRRWLPWYRGDAPCSEPETQALDALVDELRPFGLLNLHSTGTIVTYPWSSRHEPTPDAAGLEAMAAAFTAAQRDVVYRSKQSNAWYPIVGSSNDYFYDRYGILPMTVEISRSPGAVRSDWRKARRFFWYANPADPHRWIANDTPACFAALRAALDHRRADPVGFDEGAVG